MTKHEKYDTICYYAYHYTKLGSEDAERIAFRNFNVNDDEHIFLLNVAFSCWGLLGNKPVAVDSNWLERAKLSHKYRKFCKIEKVKDGEMGIDAGVLIELLKGAAFKECGTVFSFSEINEEYYNA